MTAVRGSAVLEDTGGMSIASFGWVSFMSTVGGNVIVSGPGVGMVAHGASTINFLLVLAVTAVAGFFACKELGKGLTLIEYVKPALASGIWFAVSAFVLAMICKARPDPTEPMGIVRADPMTTLLGALFVGAIGFSIGATYVYTGEWKKIIDVW